MQNTGKDGADQRRATVMVIRKQLQLADYVPEGHYSDGRYSDKAFRRHRVRVRVKARL